MIWTPYDWLKGDTAFYGSCIYTVVISSGRGPRIKARHSNQPNKSKLLLYNRYFHFNIPFKQLYASCKTERFSYKGVWGVCGHTCFEV